MIFSSLFAIVYVASPTSLPMRSLLICLLFQIGHHKPEITDYEMWALGPIITAYLNSIVLM